MDEAAHAGPARSGRRSARRPRRPAEAAPLTAHLGEVRGERCGGGGGRAAMPGLRRVGGLVGWRGMESLVIRYLYRGGAAGQVG